ncbi:hypothetical protein [Labilibaculum euxinus]
MVKKKNNTKKKKKNNIFDRAKIDFYDYEEFLDLFAQCSKRVVSENVKNVESFPKTIHLSYSDNNCPYNPEFLKKLKELFDNVDSLDKFANKIVVSIGGHTISDKSKSKKDMADRRAILNRLLTDAIKKAEKQFKQTDEHNLNSQKLYTATIKSSMVTYPPNKMSEKRFLNITSKLTGYERDLISSIYKKVDNYYCTQKRINKKNYKEIAQIFFNLKHISHEDK